MTRIWYRVSDLDRARVFYVEKLGFTETGRMDATVELARGEMWITLAEGTPEPDGPVASVDVDDVKHEAERLRSTQVDVGTVLELHNEVRVVDVFDPDGNRLQLVEEIRP
jgi:catechol 2,3-dioxygenase-like lactoylglutathione lyase family enzyme